jgi:hypothetical protein
MEAAGLAIGVAGLAGLLSASRDVDTIRDSYREFAFDLQSNLIQREAARASYQQWSESVGYSQAGLKDVHHQALDDPMILDIVQKIVQHIHTIDDCTHIDASHPSHQAGVTAPAVGDTLPGAKKRARIEKYQGSASQKDKLLWAYKDRKKIAEKTQLVNSLLQMLRELVPSSQTVDADGTREGSGTLQERCRQLVPR